MTFSRHTARSFLTAIVVLGATLPGLVTQSAAASRALPLPQIETYRLAAGSHSAASANPDLAYDGDRGTSWHTTLRTPPASAFVTFDLRRTEHIGTVHWMFARTGAADSFRIQVSSNATDWTNIGRASNAAAGTWQRLATESTGRYVRFVFANPNADPILGYLAEVQVRPPQDATPTNEPVAPLVALGVTMRGAPEDPAVLDAWTERVGRSPAIVSWYQGWGDNANWAAFQPGLLADVARRGAMPMINWEPGIPNGGTTQPAYRLANIARGDFDAYVDSWAFGLARYGRPVYLRFAHEMNGDWYPWGGNVNGNTPQDYVAAWRHVHRRFAAAGATNVRWVWSPNVEDGPGYVPMAQLYPGDAYVDWVGLDGYNWGGPAWRSFADTFGPSYATITALSPKPLLISETASDEAGGEKAAWIRDAFQTQLPRHFPRVRAIIWFDYDKERAWHVDSSAAALRAFSESVNAPNLQGTLR